MFRKIARTAAEAAAVIASGQFALQKPNVTAADSGSRMPTPPQHHPLKPAPLRVSTNGLDLRSPSVLRPTFSGAATFQANRIFNRDEVRALTQSHRVLVLEYSSTGGGHTARSLDPILRAVEKGTLKGGDEGGSMVIILAPPRWPSDVAGSQINTLHNYVDKFREKGLKVILKQSDKTVTGIYKQGGASDNVAMLRDFVYKPQRDKSQVPLSTNRVLDGAVEVERGRGESAKDILQGVIEAVGDAAKEKIVVLGDMAPYLQKAAKAAGIQKSVEIGNHQGLLIGAARQALGDKDLSYVLKASSSGLSPKLALVEYSSDLNVVHDLKGCMDALGITASTTKKEARSKVLTHLFDYAKRDSEDIVKTGGILLAKDLETEDVKAMVYLYVNEYTAGAVGHIRQNILEAEPESPYAKTLFAICARQAIDLPADNSAPDAKNILQLMYAANADGVTNAGFGTTSEFYYLAKNGSEASFVVAPVEHQHEQEANAALLKAAFPNDEDGTGRLVMSARGAQDMHAKIDALAAHSVARAAQPGYLQGDMSQIVSAASNPKTGAGHAASLLASLDAADADSMRPSATNAVDAMADYTNSDAPKQRRRAYKLLVPALDAIIDRRSTFDVRPTSKVESRTLDVQTAITLMRQGAEAGAGGDPALNELLQIDMTNENVKLLLKEAGKLLETLMQMPPGEKRSQSALDALTDLANHKLALGW